MRIQVGAATFEIAAVLAAEPDRVSLGIGFGPRLLISEEALRLTGLVQPGSLVRWSYRLKLEDAGAPALEALVREVRERHPAAGWEVRTRTSVSPQIERNLKRFSEYLTLAGLTALLIGGVGVANAVKHYLDRKRGAIAIFKAVGAPGGTVFAIFFVEICLIGLIGIAIGLAIGAALPFVAARFFAGLIPFPLEPGLDAGVLVEAGAFGFLIALAFALWPLGRAHDVPVGALFRDAVEPDPRWPGPRYVALAALAAVALVLFFVGTAYERRIAIFYAVAAAAVFLALWLLALALVAIVRRLPRPRATALRLALANIHRPAALTASVVLSLGLGMSLLVTLLLVEANMRRELEAALPGRAPSFFFLDLSSSEAERFRNFVRERAPSGRLAEVPFLRGRIVRLGGRRAEEARATPDSAWAVQSDRGITFAEAVPEGSLVVAGAWWPKDYAGPPLVSFEKRVAEGLGLKVGDTVVVNVLGREIEARIANLRAVEWESLAINFVMVFSPDAFRGAPYSLLATLTYPDGGRMEDEVALLREVAAAFPAVSAIRVKEALESFQSVVSDLATGMRAAAGLTLLASVLALAGALAAGHHARVYDAVILKTLGATRPMLMLAYGLEYAILGLATALVASIGGAFAAAYVVEQVMRFRFAFDPLVAGAAAGAAVLVTVVLALIGTWRALGEKPASILRNL
jgi:putative ABC transport system permease protein